MSTLLSLDDPNVALVERVVEALGSLCDSLVLVGGCATGLLVTNTRAQRIRATADVDLVVEVTTIHDYHQAERAFAARGFRHDTSDGAPICRWRRTGVIVDLLPSQPGVLAFHNRWYPVAVVSAQRLELPGGRLIRVIAAPAFIATKLEAFHDRGNRDFTASHDLEDIITVIDGRATLVDEVLVADAELRQYLAQQFAALLASRDFVDCLPGHLPGDSASQARLPALRSRITALTSIS